MTERGRTQLQRDAQRLQIGPSELCWHGDSLHIEVDEVAVPWPRRVSGCVRVQTPRRLAHMVQLAEGHRWCPIAPHARVDVDLGGARWSGSGYLDSNFGDAPLEHGFSRWDWSRAHLSDGSSLICYDAETVEGVLRPFAFRFDPQGGVTACPPPARASLPPTRWGLRRMARSDAGHPARVSRCLTDAPFYARSLLQARWHGEPVEAVHESLSMKRFDSTWVQAMLPFRMPRMPRMPRTPWTPRRL